MLLFEFMCIEKVVQQTALVQEMMDVGDGIEETTKHCVIVLDDQLLEHF